MQICSRQHRFLWEDMFVQVENISQNKKVKEYCKAKSCFTFRLYTHTVTETQQPIYYGSEQKGRETVGLLPV